MRERLPAQPLATLAVVLTAAGSALLAGCGELGADAQLDNADDGSLRGELVMYVADDFDGTSRTHYALRTAPGVERPLLFDQATLGGRPLDVSPGTEVKIWGEDAPEGLRVTNYRQTFRPITKVSSALINGAPYPIKSFAFVIVDLGAGSNITAETAMTRLVSGTDSIRNYYLYDSYGRQDIDAQVFGPISYTMSGCGTSQMATDLRTMIPGTFNHYLWYFGMRTSNCTWGGLGEVGSPDRPANDTWYNGSTSCVVLVQEPGHNFGMQHSSSLACPGGVPLADDPNTCTSNEYGDPFDPMGGGCRHMNAWQKTYQGWLGGCNGVSITSTGTFTLLPLEARCDGAQFLKVKAARTRPFNRGAAGGGSSTVENFAYYYVELRTPLDFDGTLGNSGRAAALAPQVQIRVGDDTRGRTQRGLHTFLLDMTPTTTSRTDSALPVGQTFNDPSGGVSITNMAVSAQQATIQVTITNGTGDPTCLDGTTFAAPGPGITSCMAGSVGGAGGGAGGAGGGAGGAGGARDGGAGGAGGGGGVPGTDAGAQGGTVGTGAGGRVGADTGIGIPRDGGKGPGFVTGGCDCSTGGGGDHAPASLGFGALLVGAALLRRTARRRMRARNR